MKKFAITLAYFLTSLFILLIICRFTGILLFYKQPTINNEPNIKLGQYFAISNLPKAKKGDYIIYENNIADSIQNYSMNKVQKEDDDYVDYTGSKYINRIVATEGDTITMTNGICYINGKNVDSQIDLMFYYIFYDSDIKNLSQDVLDRNKYNLSYTNDSTYIISLSNFEVQKLSKNVKPILHLPNDTSYCFSWLNQKHNGWTESNFGPLKIPKKMCFVLGDNRLNSMDSRFIGFINLDKIKGVKL